MVEQKGYYAAVRKTEGKEWIDNKTIEPSREDAKDRADKIDTILVNTWTEANPVQRIVPVVIREVKE